MVQFGMKLKRSSFLELSSMGKRCSTEYKKTEEKPRVNVYTINPMIFGACNHFIQKIIQVQIFLLQSTIHERATGSIWKSGSIFWKKKRSSCKKEELSKLKNCKNESIGIELDKSVAQGHDGKGKFSTRHGYELFVTTKDIHKVFSQFDGEIIGLKLQHWWLNEGDGNVNSKKYFSTEFAKGTWIGLVLDDFLANPTDGTVKWPTTTRVSGASHWSESWTCGIPMPTTEHLMNKPCFKPKWTPNVPEYDVSFDSRNKKKFKITIYLPLEQNAATLELVANQSVFAKKNESTGIEMYATTLQMYNNKASQNYRQMLSILSNKQLKMTSYYHILTTKNLTTKLKNFFDMFISFMCNQ
ncbi:hypothetical protein RFI_03099 [Reticulomyxa filosa]|uniref:CAP-Gly domain-containing protein n=1 Tax=Reticulomyxa filosa TaxID=46433 RepID=X6P721_RETFI|nr:hypothetical protein RFI_03099 [Reticulomyxa filosa]|eukprot:ETO33996.1 hypothetical protein RFI_03099 [Reticulomyxa filosa]